MKCKLAAGIVWIAVGLAAGFAAEPASAQEVDWEPYLQDVGGGRIDTLDLGRMYVPERHGAGAGADSLRLTFVRLPTRSATPGAPIVYLDGGPGGSGVGAARIPAYARLFDRLRDVADVILLSQRGTGLSEPRLVCPPAAPPPPDLLTTRTRMLEILAPAVRACAESWRERGVDLGAFNTRESADDLEDLRVGLGASRLSLLGFSYGTHLGLAALRRHGERLDRVVLIGTEGPDHTYKLPGIGDVQLRHLSHLVRADASAGPGMPDMYAAIDTLLERLDREPMRLVIEADDGAERTIELGGDGMRYLIRRDLGDTNDHPYWPAEIRMALDGNTRLLAGLAGRRLRELSGVGLMGILMDCASGATEARLARIRSEESGSILGPMTNYWYPEVCDAVPEARLDDDFRSRFVSDVPTLFLSGTLDANTPPYQAMETAWGWPDATHIVVSGVGHESIVPVDGATTAIVDFLRGQDVAGRNVVAEPLDFLSVEELTEILDAE